MKYFSPWHHRLLIPIAHLSSSIPEIYHDLSSREYLLISLTLLACSIHFNWRWLVNYSACLSGITRFSCWELADRILTSFFSCSRDTARVYGTYIRNFERLFFPSHLTHSHSFLLLFTTHKMNAKISASIKTSKRYLCCVSINKRTKVYWRLI